MTVEAKPEVRYGLSQFPAFNARSLVKALVAQGFSVDVDGEKGTITRADMGTPYHFHESVVSRFSKRGGANLLNDLVNLGFVPPDVFAKQQREAAKTLVCGIDGCERTFRLPLHLGRHQTTAHGVEPKTGSHAPKIEKPAGPRMSANGRPAASPLKVRYQEPMDDRLKVRSPAAKLAAALEVASEAAAKLLEMYDEQHAELAEMKERLRKIEQRMGRVVEAL